MNFFTYKDNSFLESCTHVKKADFLFIIEFHAYGKLSEKEISNLTKKRGPNWSMLENSVTNETIYIWLIVFIFQGDSVIVWKQPDRIISAGLGLIRKDKRLNLLSHSEGIDLQISNLRVDDSGNYICEVEHEGEPIRQTNALQILGKLNQQLISILWQ